MHTEAVPETVDIGTLATARAGDTLGYARVSTADQSLAAQRNRLLEAGAIRLFTDVASGKRSDRPVLPSSLSTLDPATACASPGSTVWDARCASCSKPSTASRPAASTWSASRSASTPLRPPASSYSTSSVRLRTSRDGSSPSAPATASRRRENSSKSDCHPLERQKNSSVLAGQRLTDLAAAMREEASAPLT